MMSSRFGTREPADSYDEWTYSEERMPSRGVRMAAMLSCCRVIVSSFGTTRTKKRISKVRHIVPRGGKVADLRGRAPADNEGDSCYALSPDGKTIAMGRSGNQERQRNGQFVSIRLTARNRETICPPQRSWPINQATAVVCVSRRKAKNSSPRTRPNNSPIIGKQTNNSSSFGTLPMVRRLSVSPRRDRRATRVRSSPCRIGSWLSAWKTVRPACGILSKGKERHLETDHVDKKPGQGFGTFAVSFTPDGTKLVTGGRDGLVKLWDVASGRTSSHARTSLLVGRKPRRVARWTNDRLLGTGWPNPSVGC